MKKLQTEMQNHSLFHYFHLTIFICGSAKKAAAEKKKYIEDEQTVAELNSVRRRSQHLVQTSYIKRIKLFLFAPYNKHFINQA